MKFNEVKLDNIPYHGIKNTNLVVLVMAMFIWFIKSRLAHSDLRITKSRYDYAEAGFQVCGSLVIFFLSRMIMFPKFLRIYPLLPRLFNSRMISDRERLRMRLSRNYLSINYTQFDITEAIDSLCQREIILRESKIK